MVDTLSRSDFIRLGGLLLASTVYSCAPRSVQQGVESVTTPVPKGQELKPIEPGPQVEVPLRLGEEKSIDMGGLEWVPDTRTSFVKKDSGFQFFFSAGRDGYLAEGPNLESHGVPQKIIEPSYKQGKFGVNQYRSPGTVFENEGVFWSLDHVEEWKDAESGTTFTARIGLSKSQDQGKNWSNSGIVLDGQVAEPAGYRITGAGQPAGITRVVDGVKYLYTYYTDWGMGSDSVHLARVPIDQIENPDAWQKSYYGSFDSRGAGGMSTPVIGPDWGEVYTALSSVSWNRAIGKYLSLFETSTGFSIATSADGVDWGNHQKIADFPEAHDERKNGSIWYSYPTILSLDTGNQFITGNRGILVYSKGVYGVSSNQMKTREFTIEV